MELKMGTAANKLDGPYRLLVDEVRLAVRQSPCGVYALGSLREDGLFAVSYVGADYVNVTEDLCNKIGTAPSFKFRAFSEPESAFLQLCYLFHSFHPSGNFVHPERPKGHRIGCPYCDLRRHSLSATAMRR
jgi:hypothetical protein